ncbi:hypothetical protein L7F22_011819 [Adiantum nelumboides]|nr:hypothetical protein [Adiantum nelumboides]
MKECFSFMIGGVGFVELLPNTNSLLLVGGGPNPSFLANDVVMWDIVKGESSGQISQNKVIYAHDSGLACMMLNATGTLFATASNRGTLVRVFSTQDGLWRGLDRAKIYNLAFSLSLDWSAVSSDKGIVHVLGLRTTSLQSTDTNANRNQGLTLSFIRGSVLPKCEWSYAQFKLPEQTNSVVAFGQEGHNVLVLCPDGR